MKVGDFVEIINTGEEILKENADFVQMMLGHIFQIENIVENKFAAFTITNQYHRYVLILYPFRSLKVVK